MDIFDSMQVSGHRIGLETTNPKHLNGKLPQNQPADGTATGFSNAMLRALNGANNLQQESTSLTQAMLTDPESVDSHDVTIAMAKANMAVTMTKSVVDGAVRAYKEIISLR
ncbi:flagellar hook-basal body complex protein FliE [Marispirochaeta sp.]|jgi:flagellar hook-basal body complex protein FliE|uniref:flagellar hook-basal body complex protein FliE n=1 Tax=Marispirochaeta sp. TaxID=2038653 RepID=UPI0029C6F2E3|nr:flagellar hook-basal body complex protein FliE [Marispirochaeta sp.]